MIRLKKKNITSSKVMLPPPR